MMADSAGLLGASPLVLDAGGLVAGDDPAQLRRLPIIVRRQGPVRGMLAGQSVNLDKAPRK
jgi:hypothetical protein